MQDLCSFMHINETNLALRRQFIGLSDDDIAVLKSLRPWAHKVAPLIAREFYDVQFAFPPTRAVLERFAQWKGVTLEQLRQSLEQTQAQYFRDIFDEAEKGGRFGVEYFERRLRIGYVHVAIHLPLKWYVGSYALYQRLVRKHLQRDFRWRCRFRARAEEAVLRVFNYDMQAVADSFLLHVVEDLGVSIGAVVVQSEETDLSDYLGANGQ